MSESDIEVIFENVVQSLVHRTQDNNGESPQSSSLRIDKSAILAEKAQKIKSETNAYLLQRLNVSTQKQEASNSTKTCKQLKISDTKLKLIYTKRRKFPVTNNVDSKNGSTHTSVMTPSKRKKDAISPKSSIFDSPVSIKQSSQLRRHPNKFSINGSPASSKKNSHILSSPGKSPVKYSPTNPVHTAPLLSFMGNRTSPKTKAENNINFKEYNVKRKLNFTHSSHQDITLGQNGTSSESNLNIICEQSSYDTAYILSQFKMHINVILKDENLQYLFCDDEVEIIQRFFSLSVECQEFYVKMHNRMYKWHRLSDIKYNVSSLETMNILHQNGFLSTDASELGIKELFDMLKIPEIKNLCKSLCIKCKVQTKGNFLEEILRYSHIQKTLVTEFSMTSSEDLIKKKIKGVVGPCFKLSTEPRKLFRRIHLLFNFKYNRNERSVYQSRDLFQIQYNGTDTGPYPEYVVDDSVKIFITRDELLRYENACILQKEFEEAVEAKRNLTAENILNTIRDNFKIELDTYGDLALAQPLSLRKFAPGTIYAYTLFSGIQFLKRIEKTEEAIQNLLLLLDQTVYVPYKRSRWFEKLISIQRTIGSFNEVAKIIQRGVMDPFKDDQGWYSMTCRAKEMLKKKKGVLPEVKAMLREIPFFPLEESLPVALIKAEALEGKAGYKRIYVQNDEFGDGKIFSSVEELVISHYCPREFARGKHAENSLITSLFGILFWNIIYDFVPFAFISHYQAKPLDMSTGEFYENRKTSIDERMCAMAKWSVEDITSQVTEIYERENGKTSMVHWSYFNSVVDIVNIIISIGWKTVLKICERYAKKYHEARSGFPDLILWTPGENNKYKFVEVKGPKDKLGANQKIWLDFLAKINANVEVCHVSAQGSKVNRFLESSEPCDSPSEDTDFEAIMECDT